jgi:sugar/nucleoside kinase (ribokinase family)
MSEHMPEVIVAGHLCLDIIPSLPSRASIPAPGHTREVGSVSLVPGGAVANVGGALSRLGMVPHLVGLVGDDPAGELLRSLVARRTSSALHGIRAVRGASTAYTLVLTHPGADRAFLHHAGVNDLFEPSRIDPGAFAGAKLFHFGYPPLMRRTYTDEGRGLADVFRELRARDCAISLDMAVPDENGESGRVDWAGFLANVLPQVDIFLPSLDELLFIFDRDAFRSRWRLQTSRDFQRVTRIAEQVLSLGASILLIKMGAAGLYLRTGSVDSLLKNSRLSWGHAWADREIRAPSFDVEVAGTTGAGDAAIAGMLAGVLCGEPPEEAITLAAAAGACVVERAESIRGVRSLTEIRARIGSGWQRRKNLDLTPEWVENPLKHTFLGPHDSTS